MNRLSGVPAGVSEAQWPGETSRVNVSFSAVQGRCRAVRVENSGLAGSGPWRLARSRRIIFLSVADDAGSFWCRV